VLRGAGLRGAFDTPEAKRRYVRTLFATIADRYDLITVLLSYGRDRRWKERLADMARVNNTTQALDLACGTGDIAFALAARGARVTGLDITPRMLQRAKDKTCTGAPVRLLAGDMMTLPFAERSFDVVTTGYGLRNVPRLDVALREIQRVLRPGGVLLSLDFNRPSNPLVRTIYLSYLTIVGSVLGLALHRDPDTYRYIPESIKRYPGDAGLGRLLAAAGFEGPEYVPVLGGLMAIHRATRPR
jgi:demethylmenaquinone methyltransferase/2-methoxy-6-polyprenyl-1,4-benzoquinol methylase